MGRFLLFTIRMKNNSSLTARYKSFVHIPEKTQ